MPALDLFMLVSIWIALTLVGSLLSLASTIIAIKDFMGVRNPPEELEIVYDPRSVKAILAKRRLRAEISKLWVMGSYFLVGINVISSSMRGDGVGLWVYLLFGGVVIMVVDSVMFMVDRSAARKVYDAPEQPGYYMAEEVKMEEGA